MTESEGVGGSNLGRDTRVLERGKMVHSDRWCKRFVTCRSITNWLPVLHTPNELRLFQEYLKAVDTIGNYSK